MRALARPLCTLFLLFPTADRLRAALCLGAAGDIHNDFAAMAATLVLGLTNGFISVNCMLHGRRMVPLDVREEAGYILTLCMSIGITLGVVLALPVNYFWAGQSL